MYCKNCGKEIPNDKVICDECGGSSQNGIIKYVSIVLAVLNAVLPFFKWLEVPVANSLYSMFGMAQETPTFSLFGYIFSGSRYQDDKVYAVMLVIAFIALIGIVLNAIYVVKLFNNKPKCCKYGTIGAIILMIMSILFILTVGLTSAILKVIKLTAVPYVTLAVSITNIIIVKKLKKQAK